MAQGQGVCLVSEAHAIELLPGDETYCFFSHGHAGQPSRQSVLNNFTSRILARLDYHHQRVTVLKLQAKLQRRQFSGPFYGIAESAEC